MTRSVRWLVVIAPAAIWLLVALPVGAESPDAYRERLETIYGQLSTRNPDRAAVASQLRDLREVELGDGTVVSPDLSSIIEAVEADPPRLDEAREQIAATLLALERPHTEAASTDAVTALDDVLARDEFQPQEDRVTLREAIGRAVREAARSVAIFTGELLVSIFGGGGSALSVGSLALGVLGIVLLGWLLFWIVRTLRREVGPRVAGVASSVRRRDPTPDEMREQADALFRNGDYREALRLLYLATLLRWEEAGRLRFDRSLTNREVISSALRRDDQLMRDRLTPLVDRFDRVRYGQSSCTADDYRAFADLASRAWDVPHAQQSGR